MATSEEKRPLQGRVAIVTGASRGIGRAIALHLASKGANLVINYLGNQQKAEEVASVINAASPSSEGGRVKAITVKADVSKASDVVRLFDKAKEAFGGPVHIVVNNAGTVDSTHPSLAHTFEQAWDSTFDINCKSTFLCSREAANRLVKGGGGRIINISSSVVTSLTPGFGAYAASKAAVETMTKILARELRGTKITANCVAPGAVATELFFSVMSDAMVAGAAKSSPFERLGEVRDVAPVVAFLASDEGEWINAQGMTSEVEQSRCLLGRVAIVTGAARGIGREISLQLAAKGAKLVINYVSNRVKAEEVAAIINNSSSQDDGVKAITVKADVSKASEVTRLFDEAEQAFECPVHILVNNAGAIDSKYPILAHSSEQVWDWTLDINCKGPFLCCREAANRIVRGGGGRIINITSTSVVSLPLGYGAYAASKAAVETMTKILARELRGARITANCVAPGPVATELFFTEKSDAIVAAAAEASPFERLGEVRDVAPVVAFLASDEGEWVNAQVLRVNGGSS
ncbi:hypothetical protein KI387_003274 [Taxus chinensis]|uniref:Uncharacterized protein n=1 Tax=Taxus chinensis TaxID=29808 RepID=A0AA38GYW0_TAXCH|nr:hypothetical protein KI387_003274 [Taxus chinensis]